LVLKLIGLIHKFHPAACSIISHFASMSQMECITTYSWKSLGYTPWFEPHNKKSCTPFTMSPCDPDSDADVDVDTDYDFSDDPPSDTDSSDSDTTVPNSPAQAPPNKRHLDAADAPAPKKIKQDHDKPSLEKTFVPVVDLPCEESLRASPPLCCPMSSYQLCNFLAHLMVPLKPLQPNPNPNDNNHKKSDESKPTIKLDESEVQHPQRRTPTLRRELQRFTDEMGEEKLLDMYQSIIEQRSNKSETVATKLDEPTTKINDKKAGHDCGNKIGGDSQSDNRDGHKTGGGKEDKVRDGTGVRDGMRDRICLRIKVTNGLYISAPTLTRPHYEAMYAKFRAQYPPTAVFLHERFQSLGLHVQLTQTPVFVSEAVVDFFLKPHGDDATLASLFARERLAPIPFHAVGKYQVLTTVLSWVNKSVAYYRGRHLRFRHAHNTLYINVNSPPHCSVHQLVHSALFDWLDLTHQEALAAHFQFVTLFVGKPPTLTAMKKSGHSPLAQRPPVENPGSAPLTV